VKVSDIAEPLTLGEVIPVFCVGPVPFPDPPAQAEVTQLPQLAVEAWPLFIAFITVAELE
jgi:hypothetical protein